MEKHFNYQIVCNNLLKGLPSRSQDVLERRFGLRSEKRATLEMIGKEYGLTRERIRQIEEDGLSRIEKTAKNSCQSLFQSFEKSIRADGGLKKEDTLILELGRPEFKNQILFLLNLGPWFMKFNQTEDFYSFWAVDRTSVERAKEVILDFIKALEKENKPLTLEKFIQNNASYKLLRNFNSFRPKFDSEVRRALFSYLEISKRILRNSDGEYGFFDWPEINPKGIRDKAYLVLKKRNKPLHFTEVAEAVQKPVHLQTVHNELIKDSRFVLVGRGIYALSEWGYQPGIIREVIFNILKKARKPLSKPEILKEVLKQRQVKENTIFLNLNNRKHFLKDSRGKYTIREA